MGKCSEGGKGIEREMGHGREKFLYGSRISRGSTFHQSQMYMHHIILQIPNINVIYPTIKTNHNSKRYHFVYTLYAYKISSIEGVEKGRR